MTSETSGRTRKRATKGATISAVAKLAGVSPMTVSNVINNKASVQPATRETVLQAIAALDYRPNAAARALASATTLRIGLMHRDEDSALLSAILVGTLRATSRLGVQLVIRSYTPDAPLDDVLAFAASGLDGLLLPPPLCERFCEEGLVAKVDIPVVALAPGRALPGMLSVRIDDEAAAHTLASSLIAHGHRRIAFVRLPGTHVGETRLAGYRRALAEHGIAEDPALIWTARPLFSAGLALAEEKLGNLEDVSAVMAGNDDMAAAFVNAALRRGMHIPEDLSITGFDDTPIAIKIWPALTTVRQPLADIAESATELLAGALRNPRADLSRPRIVDYTLIERASVSERSQASAMRTPALPPER